MRYYLSKLYRKALSLPFSIQGTNKKLHKLISISPRPSVLFICKGNICRSPYGECYLKSITEHNLNVKSAGLDTHNGLNANAVAIEEAKKRGVNLESHQSTSITNELIDQYDIIFLMEPLHYLQSVVRFPLKGTSKYMLLGLLADPPLTTKTTIDPYGESKEVFEKTFQTIESACNNFYNLLKNKGTL